MQHSHNIMMSAAVGARGSGRLLLATSLTTLIQERAVFEMVLLAGWPLACLVSLHLTLAEGEEER
jgi:hypothetical protein